MGRWTIADHQMQAVLYGISGDLQQVASLLDGLARNDEVARIARDRLDEILREMRSIVPMK